MIVITGGAGFIGKELIEQLIELEYLCIYDNIVVIDNNVENINNLKKKYKNIKCISVENSLLWLPFNANNIDLVYHLGARTNTGEKDINIFNKLNLNFSKIIWNLCVEYQIPLVYASSAATYGDGEDGFNDDYFDLKPLNPYGQSKHDFDLWVLEQEKTPPKWLGFKFFNVYGYGEDHKGKMASVIYHFYNQIKKNGTVKLFKSHIPECIDGEQKRDFIYCKDVAKIFLFLIHLNIENGIYNLGTGVARSYNDLAKIIFKCLGKEENISYIDPPIEIRDNYQYYTQANMKNLIDLGVIVDNFYTLENGIKSYIKLLEKNYENC